MKRFLLVLFAAAALGAISVVILRARFGAKEMEEDAEEGGRKGTREKRGPRDFSKGKGGLVVTTDLEKGSLLDPDAPGFPLADYVDMRDAALKPWREKLIDAEWEARPLAEVLAELQSAHGLSIRGIGVEGGEVTFRCEQMSALAVLDLVSRLSDLVWIVNLAGELLLLPAADLTTHAPPAYFDLIELQRVRVAVLEDRNAGGAREPALAKTLRNTAVAARQVPAGDIAGLLNFLSQVSEVTYVMRPVENPPTLPALIPMEGESIDVFLGRVLDPVGYTFLVNADSVEILSKEEKEAGEKAAAAREEERKGRIETEKEFLKKEVVVGEENLSIRDLATELSRALDRPLAMDPRSWRRAARYSFKAIERPAHEVIEILKKGTRLEVTLRDGKLWFLAPEDFHKEE